MKKTYLLFAVFFIAFVGLFNVQAQTDVTSTYLVNAGFDEAPTIFTLAAGGKITNADTDFRITRIDGGTSPGWRFIVTGWDETSYIKSNAVQISTAEYGFTTAPVGASSGLNTTTPPTTQKDGVTNTGASLHMSAGWGDKAIISKSVNLAVGKYKLFYDAYNAHTNAAIVTNFCGYTNSTGSVTGSLLSVPQNTWKTDSVTFTVLQDQEAGTINIGFTTSSGSSGNGAKLYIDNIKLKYYGVDKTDLKALLDSANVMKNDPKDVGTSTVYADLTSAISNAQTIYEKTAASVVEVVQQENVLKAAIESVYGAILLQTRVNTWKTFPFDATSAITNPGFESGFTGWTNDGLVVQSNTSLGTYKTGTYYAEKWVSSGTALPTISLGQTIKNIPNGLYLVTVSGQAILQSDNSYPGGSIVYADANTTEIFDLKDYSVTATVTNNTLEIGFEAQTSANWVAIDNFRLSYISDGSPYLLVSPKNLAFTPTNTQKTINIKGGNLTQDVTLTPTSSFSLSATTLTASDVMSENGVDVTVNSNATTELPNDSLIINTGTISEKVTFTAKETLTTSNAGFFFDQSITGPYSMTVTGDLYNDISITAPAGITVSENSIAKADALTGKAINVIWNTTSRIEDRYIYLISGAKKDSVLIFAVKDNIISTWDGDTATVAPSKLTDFGWSHTLADGVTSGTAAFQEYNTGGVRYVPVTNYTYKEKAWVGYRIAFLRTWGNPATNVFNLAVELEANKTYNFRGVSAWHNNETNPTFTYAVNTTKSNMGDTLGIQSVLCTVKQQGKDYAFEFTPKTSGTHYLTVSSNTKDDAMCAPMYLAIYEKTTVGTEIRKNTDSDILIYPTIAKDFVKVDMANNSGTIKLYDITGKLLLTKAASSNLETITLPAKGLFIVEVKTLKATKTVKIVNVR